MRRRGDTAVVVTRMVRIAHVVSSIRAFIIYVVLSITGVQPDQLAAQ